MTKSWFSFPHLLVFIMLVSFSTCVVSETRTHEKGPVTVVADGHAIINALINNPTIGERLREDEMTVGHMTRQNIQPGVDEYVLYVNTCGMCNPGKAKKGFVTIIEDERMTYSDGPVEYTVTFSIESVVWK